MWERFVRAMRSLFGGILSSVEDPEAILEQNIRDMNDQVPKMNESIAMVKANQTLLEKENKQLASEVLDLTSKIKAGIQAGRDDIAATYAGQLQTKKEALARNEQQLATAKAAVEKALQVKQAFLREKERKTREATEALREARRSKWQSKVADTMESFQVAGIDATHDEMLRKVQEKTAVNEARMEMALDRVDGQALQIEQDAEQIRAQELVRQMKLEMGLDASAAPTEQVAKTLGKRTDTQTN
jgi:phage shock protein A